MESGFLRCRRKAGTFFLSEPDKVIRKLEAEIVLKIQEDQKNNIKNTSLEKLERKHSKFKERL